MEETKNDVQGVQGEIYMGEAENLFFAPDWKLTIIAAGFRVHADGDLVILTVNTTDESATIRMDRNYARHLANALYNYSNCI